MALILNPEVKLRPDGGRAILFSVNSPDSLQDSAFRYLYPQQAVVLSLFNGQRDLTEIKEAVAYLFNLDLHIALQEVENVLDLPVNKEQTIRSILVEASSINHKTVRVYDPKDFIVSAEEINMSDVRCKKPCSILVLPTMRCFTNCIYCYADTGGIQRHSEFDLLLFKRLLRYAKECEIETIEFSGGDIFCRGDAFKLIECTLSENLTPTVPTKYPLSRDQVKRLRELGLSTIQISIDALSPDVIDKMMGKQNYGEKILKTLDYLGEAGFLVRTNSVLTPYNIRDAVNLVRYLAEKSYVYKSNFTCYARSLYRHDDSLFCLPSEVMVFENELNKIKSDFPNKVINFNGFPPQPYSGDENERASNFWERSFCTANRRCLVVLPNGKVTICEELYFHEYFIIGDLNKQSLMEIWNSPRALELAYPEQSLVPDGPCKSCPDFRRCHDHLGRCVRDALKAYGQPHWPAPDCPRSPVGNRMA
jgi:radical SAM protein with 4Fe4S-binding SPASM domain